MKLTTGFLLASLSLAAAPNPSFLITTGALEAQLQAKDVVILHVGSEKDYATGHIPGARLVTLADISVTDDKGLRMQLPPTEALVKAFGKLGVTDSSRIVVYPAGESIQSATRVWFTLDYLGLSARTALLDGGLILWKAQNRAVSTTPVAPVEAPATFSVKPNPALVVDAAALSSAMAGGGIHVVDARLPQFYSGEDAGGMPRGGHIPGALSLPYTSLVNADRTLKTVTQQPEPGFTVVTYCHLGMQATVPYFVARVQGFDVKLYDGSFQDWSARPELPVAPAKAAR